MIGFSLSISGYELGAAPKLNCATCAVKPLPRITIALIQKRVTEYYHLRQIDMVSAARPQSVARPRQVAMYLCRHLTAMSLPQIGARFRRDHTTVIHAIRKIEQLRAVDPELNADIKAIQSELGA